MKAVVVYKRFSLIDEIVELIACYLTSNASLSTFVIESGSVNGGFYY